MLPVVVEQVRPEVTYGLRAEVLRPGLPPLQARMRGDDDPRALHFAAYDRADRIVGVVAVLPEAIPTAGAGPDDVPAVPDVPGTAQWRLRGMAVHPDERREGVGRALLVRVLDGVARYGGGLLWCNARRAAVGFYRTGGFTPLGNEWEDPQLGPHLRMVRPVHPDEVIPPPPLAEPSSAEDTGPSGDRISPIRRTSRLGRSS